VRVEYIAISEAAKEVVWIKNFVSKLGVVPSASSPMNLYYDNSKVIMQAKESTSLKRYKHVLRHYHLIRKIINRGDVGLQCAHGSEFSDLLTKPLPQPKHEAHMKSMGIRYLLE
jgi:hypothetical protein